ncbi:transglutaminase-like cysteine peptidase [Marinicellulosiphila megalodicopiae]|uniref:transglutaminase-like cysteine peptidase n=1 Tax=Marinicellulosiphila megalodicopiae TaxID=2724896 RepID=UPI003BB0C814
MSSVVRLFWLGVLFVSCLLGLARATTDLSLSAVFTSVFYQNQSDTYGERSRVILSGWESMLNESLLIDELEQLVRSNSYANQQVQYATDPNHWKVNDYWATPVESLVTGKGDCEDYAILKYMSLRAMGVAEDKLRLMYVRALDYDEPHMVLIYYEQPNEFPLVLDNLKSEILPANERLDLKPIYSFNTQGLWLAKATAQGNKIRDNSGSKSWEQMVQKIQQERI